MPLSAADQLEIGTVLQNTNVDIGTASEMSDEVYIKYKAVSGLSSNNSMFR